MKRIRPEFARFLAVGVVNTAVSLATFRAALTVLPARVGAPAAAQAVATVLGMACSYLLNRAWTFRGAHAPRSQLARFVAGQAAMYLLGAGLLEVMIDGLRWPWVASWVATTGLMPGINYWVQRRWVFRPTPNVPPGPMRAADARANA